MKIESGQKLVFIGDSITDCGRAYPHGQGEGGLGYGYVQQVAALLGAACPELAIRVINNGCSGHTVRDLKLRWNDDVLALRPDWLCVMIGTNDVWRQFDSPTQTATHVLPDEYETTLRQLISQTKSSAHLQGLVLMTPFYIETSTSDAMRVKMSQYGAIVKKIVAENDALFVDTQAAFDAALLQTSSEDLALDKIHPTAVGHMILARAFLKTIDFAW